MTAQLAHSLDLYLASVERTPSCTGSDGSLAFEAGEDLQVHAAMVPGGRVELFAGAGYVRAELLQALAEADEDDDLDEDAPRHVQDIVARWTGGGAHWSVDVHRQTGLLTLSMLFPAVPDDPGEWPGVLEAFTRTCASWAVRLHPEPPDPRPDTHPGLAEIGSGAFLRC
ncbi:hypothetical protein H4CHR_05639 [Variovorax sp. PBS-H4]|uniref:hypothetical protein n=1 Tax=Variovorax sp. PBS-H4 TaxID=434008 RepID=UPI00131937B9|nr:hypothetical protein [Variovorax sp. PBS-H4]VTU40906.1 hypothetical protein H4CHR_05639 [Variovorax sp. PBS-H4]